MFVCIKCDFKSKVVKIMREHTDEEHFDKNEKEIIQGNKSELECNERMRYVEDTSLFECLCCNYSHINCSTVR